MGCWNETCMLTHLPILVGEPVAGLVIARRNEHGDASYPDGRYAPATLPFFGRYDDYGAVEDLENPDQTLNELRQSGICVVTSQGVHVPLQMSGDMIPQMCEASRDGRLSIEHRGVDANTNFLEATVVLIRREFYDFAVDSMKRYVGKSYVANPAFTAHALGRLNNRQHGGQIMPNSLIPVARLTAFMNICRLSYGPTCGAGSQTGVEYPFQEEFLNKIAETAKWLK